VVDVGASNADFGIPDGLLLPPNGPPATQNQAKPPLAAGRDRRIVNESKGSSSLYTSRTQR